MAPCFTPYAGGRVGFWRLHDDLRAVRSMTDARFQSIPPSDNGTSHYPGMVKVRIGQTERAVHCYGWGAEAERRAEDLARKIIGEGVDE
jgi:hypothetical protein